MKFSFVIPVYNSEKYLSTCVDSILNQTHTDLEILLIDDGSSDNSPQICDDYAKRDCRVKAFHKVGGGTADARNYGLLRTTGDYTAFIDNDDYWDDLTALEKISEQLDDSNADVLMFKIKEYWENKDVFVEVNKSCDRDKIVGKNRNDALQELIGNGLLYRAVWAKIVKTKLIKDNDIYFTKGLRNEDTEWTAKMLLCATSYDWCDRVFYVYRKGTGVAQTDVRVTEKEVKDLQHICDEFIHIASTQLDSDKKFRELFLAYLAYPYAVLIGQTGLINNKVIRNEIKKYAYILQYDYDPTVKKVKAAYNILGYNLTAWLLKLYFLVK